MLSGKTVFEVVDVGIVEESRMGISPKLGSALAESERKQEERGKKSLSCWCCHQEV
jgi:hypothetical protein